MRTNRKRMLAAMAIFLLAATAAVAEERREGVGFMERFNHAVDTAAQSLMKTLNEKRAEPASPGGFEIGVFPVAFSDNGVLELGRLARERMVSALGSRSDVSLLAELAAPNAAHVVKGKMSPPVQGAVEIVWTVESRAGDIHFDHRILATASSRIWLPGDQASLDRLLAYVNLPPGKADLARFNVPALAVEMDVAARRRIADAEYEELQLESGGWLRSDDQFRIRLRPNADCHAYVFIRDSLGDLYSLFPSPGIGVPNKLMGGLSYWLPEPDPWEGRRWFYLDENKGTETLFLVASHEAIANIDKLLARVAGGGGDAESVLEAWAVENRQTDNRRFKVIDNGTLKELGDIFPVVTRFAIAHR